MRYRRRNYSRRRRRYMRRRGYSRRRYRNRRGTKYFRNLVYSLTNKLQERKEYSGNYTILNKNFWTEILFGTNITKGNSKGNRIGDEVTLRGIRVEYNLRHKGTDAGVPGIDAGPLYFMMYLIETTRDTSPETYFYKADGGVGRLDFGTLMGIDPQRALNNTLNTNEFKVIYKKVAKINPPLQSIESPALSLRSGKFFVPLNRRVKWFTGGTVVPFAYADIRPRFFFISFVIDGNPPGYNNNLFDATFNASWFYRE